MYHKGLKMSIPIKVLRDDQPVGSWSIFVGEHQEHYPDVIKKRLLDKAKEKIEDSVLYSFEFNESFDYELRQYCYQLELYKFDIQWEV